MKISRLKMGVAEYNRTIKPKITEAMWSAMRSMPDFAWSFYEPRHQKIGFVFLVQMSDAAGFELSHGTCRELLCQLDDIYPKEMGSRSFSR